MKSTRSEQERQEVAERFLGQARLDRYRRELPDLEKALALHSWNQEYAGALHVILSYAEIALRNSIDHALSQLSTSARHAVLERSGLLSLQRGEETLRAHAYPFGNQPADSHGYLQGAPACSGSLSRAYRQAQKPKDGSWIRTSRCSGPVNVRHLVPSNRRTTHLA